MGHFRSTAERIAAEEHDADAMPSTANPPFLPLADDPMDQPFVEEVAAVPAPPVGTPVQYWLRDGDFRRGQSVFPATISRVYEDGTADLIVMIDANDFMDQQRQPRRAGGERGWLPLSTVVAHGQPVHIDTLVALRTDFEAFKALLAKVILGENEEPSRSVLDMLNIFDDRLVAIEDNLGPSRAAAKAAKTKAKAPAKPKG
jgi:hypothetical protein